MHRQNFVLAAAAPAVAGAVQSAVHEALTLG